MLGCGTHHVVPSAGTFESPIRASTSYESCMNRRMPNGTYGGVRGGNRKAPHLLDPVRQTLHKFFWHKFFSP